jgi:hypothetical protein
MAPPSSQRLPAAAWGPAAPSERELTASRGEAEPGQGQGAEAPVDDGLPVSYVIASAVFLAIAMVGFGVWLAFAVISL